MRGEDNKQEGMFSYVSPEKRVPTDHPLRPIRAMVDSILKEMSAQFAKRYSDVGRPSIAPERSTDAPHPNTASQIVLTSLSECCPPSPGSAATDDRSARASPAIHN